MRKALSFLGILNDSDIGWLVSAGKKLEIHPGQTLIGEDQPIAAVYLILSGLLSLTVNEREVDQLRAGEIVGEMSFADSLLTSTAVKAMERSLVLAVPRSRIAEKLDADVAFGYRFYRALAVILASRLRLTIAALGNGSSKALEDKRSDEEEIDPDTLSNITLAGARFEWIQKALQAG